MDKTYYLTQCTVTGPTSPSSDPITSHAKLGTRISILSDWYDWTWESGVRTPVVEEDALSLGHRGGGAAW